MPVRQFGKEELKYLKQVIGSGHLSVLDGGKMQTRFERAFAQAHGVKYSVAMNSAMSVLHASVIVAGVGPGDEVICDPVCVFGAVAVLYQRAKPVFVDCKPVTFNMDPEKIKDKISSRTKAILVTHIGGLPAEMDRIVSIARKHKLMVIEDCAHAFLATYKGRHAGAWGDIGSFSFQASKQLGLGDGGMAITKSKKIASDIALHAGAPTFHAVALDVYYNYRMNEQTAAIGLAQLPKVRRVVRELIKIAKMWDAVIEDCPWLVAQRGPKGAQSTYHRWVATFEGEKYGISRKRFLDALARRGWPFSVGYTNLVAYNHPVFKKIFPKGTYPKGLCPNAEYMMPRVCMGNPLIPLDKAKQTADAIRDVIKELG